MIRNLRHRPNTTTTARKYSGASIGIQEMTLSRNETSEVNYHVFIRKYVNRRCIKNILGMLMFLSALSSLMIPILFGRHPVHGGYIGIFLDSRIKLHLWNKKVKEVERQASELGLYVPLKSIQSRTLNVPYATTLELMHRYMEKQNIVMAAWQKKDTAAGAFSSKGVGPPQMILRRKHVWNRPLRLKNSSWVVLDLDFEDLDRMFLNTTTNNNWVVDDEYQSFKGGQAKRMEMLFITLLCRYGGIYLNAQHNTNEKDLQEFLLLAGRERAISEWQDVGWISIRDDNMDSLIVGANNTFLNCIVKRVRELSMKNPDISIFHAIVNVYRSMQHGNGNGNGKTNGLEKLPKTCKPLPLNFTMSAYSKQDMAISYNLPVKDISVNITAVNEPIPKYTTKITMDQLLLAKSRFCNGIWMWPCHRCLKSALQGSYGKCSWVCSSCLDMMYDRSAQNDKTDNDDDQTVHVDIHVDGYNVDSSKYKFIPRIIHQTWFEHITPTSYPYLYRLQNQWKISGWEYRFYTDDTARQYIIDHYPLHFLEAYDALIPGAYKADLFRYMLLLREGGVYADMDVMLEVSLDQFVTPGMSFFTPRDCVAEFADGQYCLWNGIIGVAPGHPIIVRAVERLVNAILKRSDLLDLEKEVAQKSGVNTETWKVRAVQELLLSGPCALGIAVNEVLGRNSLTRFGVGWINDHIDNDEINPQQFGDMMILMVSLFETWKCKRLLSFRPTNFFLLSKINKTWVQCALLMSRED